MGKSSILKTCYIIIGFSILFIITACKNGDSINQAVQSYGKLTSYNGGARYSLQAITNTAYLDLCLGSHPNDKQCQKNLHHLKNNYGFNIAQIKNNNLGITAVNEYNITYTTPGLSTVRDSGYQPRIVSGAVYIPQGIASDKIKGVVLISHLTAYNKKDFGPKADIISGLGYPAIYAANGYIVLLADGLGFGLDRDELQPFCYPRLNAITNINMLKASQELFSKLGLHFVKPLDLYLNGFSYGGLVTVWISDLLQNHGMLNGINMQLKATVPMAGPFDFKNVQWPMERTNVNVTPNTYKIENQYMASLSKPGLVSLMMTSYEHYNNVPCTNDMVAGYCNLNAEHAAPYSTVYQLFNSSNQPSTEDIQDILWLQAKTLRYSQIYNSINSFTVAKDNSGFLNTLYSAGLVEWKTSTPVTLIHLSNDSLVSPLNSDKELRGIQKLSNRKLVNSLEIKNNDYLAGTPLSPIDHNNNVQYVAALYIFNKNNSISKTGL